MGTLLTYKSTPIGLALYAHVQSGKTWDAEEYSDNYGEYVPANSIRIQDNHATVSVELDEDGNIFGFIINLSDSAIGFKEQAGK